MGSDSSRSASSPSASRSRLSTETDRRATRERRNGRTLTVEGYRDSGGVASAIAQTADSFIASLPAEQREMARGVCLRLTDVGDDVAGSRRRVTIDELVAKGVSPKGFRRCWSGSPRPAW